MSAATALRGPDIPCSDAQAGEEALSLILSDYELWLRLVPSKVAAVIMLV